MKKAIYEFKNKDLGKKARSSEKKLRDIKKQLNGLVQEKDIIKSELHKLKHTDIVENFKQYIGKYYCFNDEEYLYIRSMNEENETVRYITIESVDLEERENKYPHMELVITDDGFKSVLNIILRSSMCSKKDFQKALLKVQNCLDDVFNSRTVLTEKKL